MNAQQRLQLAGMLKQASKWDRLALRGKLDGSTRQIPHPLAGLPIKKLTRSRTPIFDRDGWGGDYISDPQVVAYKMGPLAWALGPAEASTSQIAKDVGARHTRRIGKPPFDDQDRQHMESVKALRATMRPAKPGPSLLERLKAMRSARPTAESNDYW